MFSKLSFWWRAYKELAIKNSVTVSWRGTIFEPHMKFVFILNVVHVLCSAKKKKESNTSSHFAICGKKSKSITEIKVFGRSDFVEKKTVSDVHRNIDFLLYETVL